VLIQYYMLMIVLQDSLVPILTIHRCFNKILFQFLCNIQNYTTAVF